MRRLYVSSEVVDSISGLDYLQSATEDTRGLFHAEAK